MFFVADIVARNGLLFVVEYPMFQIPGQTYALCVHISKKKNSSSVLTELLSIYE
jgi:hypothetical protein